MVLLTKTLSFLKSALANSNDNLIGTTSLGWGRNSVVKRVLSMNKVVVSQHIDTHSHMYHTYTHVYTNIHTCTHA